MKNSQLTSFEISFISGKPSDESVWAITSYGDIFVWDPTRLEGNQLREDEFYVQKYDLSGKESPFRVALHVGCIPGTIITLTGCIGDEADRVSVNLEASPTCKLKHKAHTELENICFHINPRFSENAVIRNAMIEGQWGVEEKDGGEFSNILPNVKVLEFGCYIKCKFFTGRNFK